MNARSALAAAAISAALLLVACTAPDDAKPSALAAPPEGWDELPSCVDGEQDPWVWVDGFPVTELEKAGITTDCGDLWLPDDGDNFLGVFDPEVSRDELDDFGTALEESGYELYVEDLPEAGDDDGGARDYYSADLATFVTIELYTDDPDSGYRAYIDYHSPATRSLR